MATKTNIDKFIERLVNFDVNMSKSKKWSDRVRSYHEENIEAVNSHNKHFSRILELYCENLNNSFIQKRFFKTIFFIICCSVLVAMGVTAIVVIGTVVYMTFKYQNLKFDINGIYTILGGTLGAFLTSFIVLPYVISRYLFNTYEENNLMQIVRLIKEHDIKIRESIESNTYDFDAPKVYSSNSEKISITNHVDNQKSSDEHAGAKTPNSPIDK